MTMFRSLPGLGLSRASETEDSFVVFGADGKEEEEREENDVEEDDEMFSPRPV